MYALHTLYTSGSRSATYESLNQFL